MSLIARHLEAHGIPTLCIASALDIIEAGNPPRTVFVDYPLGHTVGKPFDPADQRAIVAEALDTFETMTGPGEIVRLERRWSDDEGWKVEAFHPTGDDTRAPRDTTPQYQSEEDRRLAEGA